MTIKTSRKAGFSLVEIMIVVAIIGLLAAIAVPNFARARTTSQMNACLNNLRQIDGAIQQYILENKLAPSDGVTAANVAPYLKTGNRTTCPSMGTAAGATLASCYAIVDGETDVTCNSGVATHVLP